MILARCMSLLAVVVAVCVRSAPRVCACARSRFAPGRPSWRSSTSSCARVGVRAVVHHLFPRAFVVCSLIDVKPLWDKDYWWYYVMMRTFTIMFAVLAVLVEFTEDFVEKIMGAICNWLGRGIFQVFIALLTLTACTPGADPISDTAQTLQEVGAYIFIGVGILYFTLGIFGGRQRKQVMQTEEYRH